MRSSSFASEHRWAFCFPSGDHRWCVRAPTHKIWNIIDQNDCGGSWFQCVDFCFWVSCSLLIDFAVLLIDFLWILSNFEFITTWIHTDWTASCKPSPAYDISTTTCCYRPLMKIEANRERLLVLSDGNLRRCWRWWCRWVHFSSWQGRLPSSCDRCADRRKAHRFQGCHCSLNTCFLYWTFLFVILGIKYEIWTCMWTKASKRKISLVFKICDNF